MLLDGFRHNLRAPNALADGPIAPYPHHVHLGPGALRIEECTLEIPLEKIGGERAHDRSSGAKGHRKIRDLSASVGEELEDGGCLLGVPGAGTRNLV